MRLPLKGSLGFHQKEGTLLGELSEGLSGTGVTVISTGFAGDRTLEVKGCYLVESLILYLGLGDPWLCGQ